MSEGCHGRKVNSAHIHYTLPLTCLVTIPSRSCRDGSSTFQAAGEPTSWRLELQVSEAFVGKELKKP